MAVEEEIERRLSSLKNPEISLQDDSASHAGHAGAIESGGGHYNLIIISDSFKGKSRIIRHRMVYEKLADLIPSKIHALSIQTYTTEEF